MKNLKFVIILLLIVGCSKSSKKELPTNNSHTVEEITTQEDISNKTPEATSETLRTKEVSKKTKVTDAELQNTIDTFINCKANSSSRKECRNAITAFISTTYGLNEFKDKLGNYEIYDSIQPIIKRTKAWKSLGSAINQRHIDKAVSLVQNGGLALVIDTSESYGHVTVIRPSETKKSGSWNLELPKVLSLFNNKPEKSFYNKSLAYAFKKSDALKIFIRE